ncbi:membrane protein insertion efficiency factor YidD [Rubritalea marina]|uniref:membrane protein insertion efficiency factor YidD n=1 Tax=Rubritalea marina TaxID=361055 RepID=UPI000A03CB14|nr:membrane protein insertion efficiency factor YidD [Rubritalea marina]
MKRLPVRIIQGLIRGYQKFLNPMLRVLSAGTYTGCRFSPSCSQYFYEAVEMHGAIKGSLLGIGRLCRCHPWGGFGHDPVPPKKKCCCCDQPVTSHKESQI